MNAIKEDMNELKKLRKASERDQIEDARQEALTKLRDLLSPGQTVWTVIRHVARSGMQRSISTVIVDGTGEDYTIESLDFWISRALNLRTDTKNGGLKVGGCGMDMGFHLVYSLGQKLWPEGTPKPHGKRNGQPDRCGGYALKQRWL